MDSLNFFNFLKALFLFSWVGNILFLFHILAFIGV